MQRSRIVLAAAAGKSNQQIAGELHMPEVTVGKWRRSFAQQGLQGLEDAPRSGRPVMHGPEIVQRVQTRVCEQPEHYSRWSVRTLAEDLKLPRSTVHQILVASNLQPHRIRTFTFSPDPDFEAKLLDVVAGSARGFSPPASHRTVRDSLKSYGSCTYWNLPTPRDFHSSSWFPS